MRGLIALRKHCVRNSERALSCFAELWTAHASARRFSAARQITPHSLRDKLRIVRVESRAARYQSFANDVYVTAYYNSKGPEVNVGRFGAGLASAKEADFLATIAGMMKD
jgi:hypothetical protein